MLIFCTIEVQKSSQLQCEPTETRVIGFAYSQTLCARAFRSTLVSGAVIGILPAINTFGVLATNTAVALLCWIGFTYVFLPPLRSTLSGGADLGFDRFTLSTIKYGDRMRAWVDLGFSTVANN